MSEDSTKACLAVGRALTKEEEDIALSASAYLYPSLNGAPVADIIDILDNSDHHLWWTEPLYAGNEKLIAEAGLSPYVWNYAVQACILKGPTIEEVMRVARKAQALLSE